jgi:hypothetical protein
MMVAMGHGLCVSFCVCGETTKNKVGPKKKSMLISLLVRPQGHHSNPTDPYNTLEVTKRSLNQPNQLK